MDFAGDRIRGREPTPLLPTPASFDGTQGYPQILKKPKLSGRCNQDSQAPFHRDLRVLVTLLSWVFRVRPESVSRFFFLGGGVGTPAI